MSLYWDVNKPAGQIYLPAGQVLICYQGNAYFIMIYETPVDYMIVSFWANVSHMKNCLGLTNGYDNCYVTRDDNWNGSKWVLYKNNCMDAARIAECLVRAFDAVTVQVLPIAPKIMNKDSINELLHKSYKNGGKKYES